MRNDFLFRFFLFLFSRKVNGLPVFVPVVFVLSYTCSLWIKWAEEKGEETADETWTNTKSIVSVFVTIANFRLQEYKWGGKKKKWNMKNNMVTQLCIEQWFTNQLYQFVEINNKRFITFHAREYAMCEYIQMILPEIQIFNNWILPIFLGYFVNIGEWRVPWNLYPNETTQQNASSSYSMSFVSFTKAYNAYTYACTVNLQVTFAIQFTMILGKRQISIAPITGGIKIRCKYDRRSNELIQF